MMQIYNFDLKLNKEIKSYSDGRAVKLSGSVTCLLRDAA